MKKIIYFVLSVYACLANATVITNGSFETGDFSAWNTQDLFFPFFPQLVTGDGITPGPFGFFSSSPTDGNFAALNSFDGTAGLISLSQTITLDAAYEILFDYRAAWNMQTFPGSTLDRLFEVNINSLGGENLANFNVLTAAAGSLNLDTGDLLGRIDLSEFTGQTLNISFDWTIPEDFTGPAFFQLDNIRATAVSEPSSIILIALSLLGMGVLRRKTQV